MSYICVCVSNPMRATKKGRLVSEWLDLPATQEEIEETLAEIGVCDGKDDYFISDRETDNFDIPIDQFTDLKELNRLMVRIEAAGTDDYFKLAALIELAAPKSLTAIYGIIDSRDDYDFLSEIQDDEALGRYFILECDMLQGIPENEKYDCDFKSFGLHMRLKHDIKYTSFGAIYRK